MALIRANTSGGGGSSSANLKEILTINYTYGSTVTYNDADVVNNTTSSGNWNYSYSGNYISAVNRASGGFKFTVSALQAGTYYIHAVIGSTVIIDDVYNVSSAQDLEIYDSSTTSGKLVMYVVACA